ncbi:hypothetical protein EXIGLDRAFT_693095 [Exidia glandulosa HHB12029]|uniref:Uncharacterized protein n=1 Tax=Exidia glandulosa HHB12029 TaxID=1314781 RepID=A0A165HJF7_EXIGL|nr:hypothetical protein EXIGLDRAFT_693095 [Exidia glandulosa HHB12029]
MCPEGGELIVSHAHLLAVLDVLSFRRNSSGWPLVGIWANHTKAEREAIGQLGPPPECIARKQAVKLESWEALERGTLHDRGTVWPLDFKSLDGMELVDIHLSAKSLMLDFKKCVLDVRVPGLSQRTFKIIMALEFPDYVLALLTKDLLAKPAWSKQHPAFPPDVFPGFETDLDNLPIPHEWWQLLAERVHIVLKKGPAKCTALAICAFRTTYAKYFPGLGLSPSLTVGEVVGDPSRFARFVEAYYVFMFRAKRD